MAATILVMDDDQSMRELLRLHLSNAGYKVLLAEDAIDGGHLLLRQRPDLVLADIVEAEAQAKKLGAAAFLTKPLFLPELLSTVAQHVEGRIAV